MTRSFDELPLTAPMRDAVAKAGYIVPTPIQARAIGVALAGGECKQRNRGQCANGRSSRGGPAAGDVTAKHR